MEDKISQLAEKLLKEGVELGEIEKNKIIDTAHETAKKVIADAEKRAAALIQDAEAKSIELRRTSESEIARAGEQAIQQIKQKISDLVMTNAVEKSATESLANPAVMAEYIKIALQNWKGGAASVEILLPESSRATLEQSLRAAIGETFSESVTISFTKMVSGGFQIAPSGSTYKITLSDEDFAGFFKEYLRPRVRSILFGE